MEKLKENVAYKVANDASLIREVAGIVAEDLDYTDIATELNISSSDIADEIDQTDLLSDITDSLDMDDLKQAIVHKCDMNEIADKVLSMLPEDFMDELSGRAADEIIMEMASSKFSP